MTKKIDYGLPRPHRTTRKGTRPNDAPKAAVPGSGKGKPAKGYDPITKTWKQTRSAQQPLERQKSIQKACSWIVHAKLIQELELTECPKCGERLSS